MPHDFPLLAVEVQQALDFLAVLKAMHHLDRVELVTPHIGKNAFVILGS
ncbi:MAG: hypothetical protein U5O39_01040 [Gammaproteobacteria bacterium]|nr:hypothetical protein [Gammaproteobacteria bacterium]